MTVEATADSESRLTMEAWAPTETQERARQVLMMNLRILILLDLLIVDSGSGFDGRFFFQVFNKFECVHILGSEIILHHGKQVFPLDGLAGYGRQFDQRTVIRRSGHDQNVQISLVHL